MNLSFAGCGFLGIYHVGVAVCFKKYAPHLLLHKISGASAGALAATCLLCDMPLGEMTSDFFRVVNEARSYSLGPFSPSFNIQTCILEGLQKFLPDDAHERVNGKLNISLTRVYDGKNVIVSTFANKHDLLQALLCACFIPGFSGILPPRFHGVRYMDGAFSDNLPVLDENTVTVSPFCGESDICPRDDSAQLFHVNWANTSIEVSKQNIGRFARILFPPKSEVLSKMCQQGFDDALKFLHKNNLISCTRCLAVQSTFVVQDSTTATTTNIQDTNNNNDSTGQQQDYDPDCNECIKHRKDALIGNMPDTVVTVFQAYIETANKGLASWIFRHRTLALLKVLSLPAIVPADILCATLTNIVGDSFEQKEFKYQVLANIKRSSPSSSLLSVMPKHVHHNNNNKDDNKENNTGRIFNATPSLKEHFLTISKYLLDQLNSVIKMKEQEKKMPTSFSCEISINENGIKPKSMHSISHRSSRVDIMIENEKQLIAGHNNNLINGDRIPSINLSNDVDTFDHILEVTSHHEALYAYYYMDESSKKVKINEIFDMSENENPALQTLHERETNEQLEFDSEWDDSNNLDNNNNNNNLTAASSAEYMHGLSSYGYGNMIGMGDIINDDYYDIFNNDNQNNNNLPNNNNYVGDRNNNYSSPPWPKVQIEEITNNDEISITVDDDEKLLLSDNASKLLSKPSSHSIYQIYK